MIISFEGGEGVGKSTHSKRLMNHLNERGLPCLSLREPGGSPFSEQIRQLFFEEGLDPATELLLVLASRRENITKIIEPALQEGKVVIIDRFIDSTLVYQGLLRGIGIDAVRKTMELTSTWLEPDLTFVLDVAPERSLARIKPGDKFENQGIEFHEKIHQGFKAIAKDRRHMLIDADQPKDVVSSIIIEAADRLLSL